MPTYEYVGLKNKEKVKAALLSQVTYKIDDLAKIYKMNPQRVAAEREKEHRIRLAEISEQVDYQDSCLDLWGHKMLKGVPYVFPEKDEFTMDGEQLALYDKLENLVKARTIRPIAEETEEANTPSDVSTLSSEAAPATPKKKKAGRPPKKQKDEAPKVNVTPVETSV